MKVSTFKPTSKNFNYAARDAAEKKGMDAVMIAVSPDFKRIATVRIYRRTGARCTVGFWLHSGTFDAAAMSHAGGGGYHKASAALESAMRLAGVEFDTAIAGVGEGAMRSALCAVCDAAGFPTVHIVEA